MKKLLIIIIMFSSCTVVNHTAGTYTVSSVRHTKRYSVVTLKETGSKEYNIKGVVKKGDQLTIGIK